MSEQNPHADLLAGLGISPDESRSLNEQDGEETPRTGVKFSSTFHGNVTPPFVLQKEKPIHKVMNLMVVKGATYREIAKATGYTYTQVSAILRQPFMREAQAQLIADAGMDPVLTLIQNAGMDSVYKLLELRDTAPPTVALGATKELLDRLMGKAPQHIITEKKTPEDPQAEKERLLKEITTMQNKLPRGVAGVGGSGVDLSTPSDASPNTNERTK